MYARPPTQDDANGDGMQSRATNTPSSDGLLKPDPSNHPIRKAARKTEAAGVAEPLPFNNSSFEEAIKPQSTSSIPTHTSTPRFPPKRQRPRLFGLEETPTFYPTWEEFADPLKYVEWVSSPDGGNGADYGIVKIVPPEGWSPEFVLDQEVSLKVLLRSLA